MLVPDLLRDRASRCPERTAVRVDGHGTMSYSEWEARSNGLARGLVERGLSPGDRVALLAGNQDALAFLVAYFAIHKAGGVAVPLNVRLAHGELARLVAHAEPALLLHGSGFEETARRLAPKILLDPEEQAELASRGTVEPFQVPRTDRDLADILYTSGTTGFPRGVACTHGNVTWKGSSNMDQLFEGATFLHAIPLFTFAGTHAMTLMPLRGGMTSVILPAFDAGRWIELATEHRANVAYAVPAMLRLILEHPKLREGTFESLRLLMYGTSAMPPGTIGRLAAAFPQALLLNLYGLTEGGAAVCLLPPHEAATRPDSIGRPLPPVEVRVVDEDGRPLPPREKGEILLRAPIEPRSYWKDEHATRETWSADGWVRTGDVGFLDEDGYLYLVDRKKDLIVRGGLKVPALEVEATLLEHPAVREAAVVGVTHPVLGEDTKAFLVLREGQSATPAELEAFCRERLADFKVPRRYAFVSELPRNAIGKVLKRALRQGAAP